MPAHGCRVPVSAGLASSSEKTCQLAALFIMPCGKRFSGLWRWLPVCCGGRELVVQYGVGEVVTQGGKRKANEAFQVS